mmetsp:Transcript_48538/g.109356  ORF Transcript_48538/g.109356 Transcript_48538/m.109356 type:complete len:574 (-) Transcript_48538:472-2193(-)
MDEGAVHVSDISNDVGFDQCELDEIMRSLQPRVIRSNAASGLCWGGCLAGDSSKCDEFDKREIRSNHFKHKLCAHCQQHGLHVPIERVRAITPDQHDMFSNKPSMSVWSVATLPDGQRVAFRTINQTSKCRGYWLVVFHSQPPSNIPWAPLPAGVNNGLLWLHFSRGTLVPVSADSSVPHTSTLAAVGGSSSHSELDWHSNGKRGRSDTESGASIPGSSRQSPASPQDEDTLGEVRIGAASVQRLLLLHTALQQELARVLGDSSEASAAALAQLPDTLDARTSPLDTLAQPPDTLGAAPPLDTGSADAPSLDTGGAHASPREMAILGSDQLRALASLLAPLRRSAAALRKVNPDPDGEQRGASDGGAFSWFGSNPPSPPGSGRRVGEGRWSSHLCACLTDPMSCAAGGFCWPIVAGQLGQKVVGMRNLCVCFTLPMLMFVAVNSFLGIQRVRVASDTELYIMKQRVTYAGLTVNGTFDGADDCACKFWHGLWWLSGFGFGSLVIWDTMLRILVRQRDTIPGSPVRDLCVSLWTSCCCLSLCQLARHEGLVGGRYGVMSPTGEKQRTQVAVMAV